MRALRACGLGLLIAAMAGSAALAHHSFAMFDRDKTSTLVGTVKEFDMINPHGWLTLAVADSQGRVNEWSLETGGSYQMRAAGWREDTVKAGDKVTARVHPLRDGSNGGQLVSALLADGRTLSPR